VAAELAEYHRRLVETMEDAVITTDDRFIVTAWNPGAETLYGWTAEQVRGRHVRDVFRTAMPEADRVAARQRTADDGRFRLELVAYRMDGSPVEVEIVNLAIHGESGQLDGFLGIHREIGDRNRASADRARWERHQALIADLDQRALAHHGDVQGLLNEAVALVARTLEVDLVAIAEPLPDAPALLIRAGIGWKTGVVGHATEPAGAASQSGYALQRGEAVVAEDLAAERRFTSSPVVRDHDAISAASVAIGRRQEPFGVLGALATSRRAFSHLDVGFLRAVANVLATEIERAEAQEHLREVRENERRRLARDLHDEVLGDLSHAVALASLAAAEVERGEATQRLAAVLPALKRVGERLRGAIYDLRVGQTGSRPFRELVEDLIEVHRSRDGGGEIHLAFGDGLPDGALSDTGTEVLRIVGEALTNARSHSGTGRIRVDAWGSKGRLFVTVSDAGRGFSPGTAPGNGHGIGLGAMRERADLLDATLQIKTYPGAGTEVRLEVPLPGPADAPARAVRVLLVENHTAVREAIAAAFDRQPDFQVTGQAASLAEARTMLAGVDVAVLDLRLPDGFGGDLVAELRAVNPDAQALVLSASLDRAEIARAVEQGAAGALDKTVHLDEVAETVRRLRAGETLLSLDEIIELVRYAERRRDRQSAERHAADQLTDREREVLQALADGLDSQATADRLQISLRTQRNHVSKILTKLDLHSQLQALVFALRHHVVELRDAPRDR
jgi:PAS domain S-box-containing protein